jgi:hypothetical protein
MGDALASRFYMSFLSYSNYDHNTLKSSMADPANLVLSILGAFVTMKKYLEEMKGNIEALSNLVNEVLIYEQLIKQTSTQPTDAHANAIRNFHEGIKGLESILDFCASEQEKKGFFQRAYSFCSDWCSAPDNAKKIREYSEKITKAAQLLGFSTVTRLEQKAEILISQGIVLQSSLDAAITKLKETQDPKAFACEVSILLKMDMKEIMADLKLDHKELKDQMSQIHSDLEALKFALNDQLKPALLTVIKSEDARLFWERFFGTGAKVTSNEMKMVRDPSTFSASSPDSRTPGPSESFPIYRRRQNQRPHQVHVRHGRRRCRGAAIRHHLACPLALRQARFETGDCSRVQHLHGPAGLTWHSGCLGTLHDRAHDGGHPLPFPQPQLQPLFPLLAAERPARQLRARTRTHVGRGSARDKSAQRAQPQAHPPQTSDRGADRERGALQRGSACLHRQPGDHGAVGQARRQGPVRQAPATRLVSRARDEGRRCECVGEFLSARGGGEPGIDGAWARALAARWL